MKTIPAVEKRRLGRYSSIYQNRGMLSIRRGDEWVPICYDVLEKQVCDQILHHKGFLVDEDYIGYQFPVKECTYLSQQYIVSDQKGTELKVLPDWYGAGFYEEAYNRDIVVNSDNGALGTTQATTLRVGLDYVLAKDTLDPVK